MKRNEKIFTTEYNTIAPTKYIKDIMLKCNRNILEGKEDNEAFEGLSYEEIKDLCTYHTDSYVLQFKTHETGKKWIELSEIYK